MEDDKRPDHNLSRPPVWYLPGPFTQYNENVKALAKAAKLRIIDATETTDRSYAADESMLPKVTIKGAAAPTEEVAEQPRATSKRGG